MFCEVVLENANYTQPLGMLPIEWRHSEPTCVHEAKRCQHAAKRPEDDEPSSQTTLGIGFIVSDGTRESRSWPWKFAVDIVGRTIAMYSRCYVVLG